ncbi:MAG: polymer-forming cytoskeletal protein, partial [Pseudomonadota bacterium]
MNDISGAAIIGADTAFEGRLLNARIVEIHGLVTGELSAEHVRIARGGIFHGRLMARTAEINGDLQGEIFVKS